MNAVEVRYTIEGLLVTLSTPDRFAEAVEQLMQGGMAIAVSPEPTFKGGAQARRLVDRQLFLDRQMQRQMEEGVHRTIFGRPFALQRGRIGEQRVVLGMQGDQIGSQGFQRCRRQFVATFDPGINEKPPRLITTRVEHWPD